ncbi:MAG: hypothetical protein P4L73_13455 [Caulobacteraceae bacterium]|nr:hypothetical protein [Caulobacteraceae bacterium]
MRSKRKAPAATPPGASVPEHVAIVGLGPSLETYVDLTRRLGGRRRLADETWGINALGDVIVCDRVFHMDDVRIQEVRAQARPESNIAVMLAWMKSHPGPIYTSRPHPDYPGLVEFPLQDVINTCRDAYFNSTAAYAVAFAIHIGVKKISLFGCDYTYPNAHHAEKGKACVEFWLGFAMAIGIEVCVAEASSLLDMVEGRPLYGYGAMGTRDVAIAAGADGAMTVSFTERQALPTADEIERAYDHSRHPSALVKR